MAEIKASANFSSVVQELSKVTTAYTEYNKKAGKAITTNKILITSFKDLNSVLKITTDLINSTSAPLRTYTKNFDQSTQSIRGAKTATSGLASENRNFVITVQKTKKDLEATSIALLDVQEKYRTGINTLVKSRDALTAWGKQAIKNVGVIERNGKTVLTFNNKIRSTTKDVLKLSKTLVELRAKGNVGRSFTNSANKLRVMRQENEKLNRTLRDGLGPMAQISKATGKYGSRTGSASKQIGKTANAVGKLTLSMQTFARLGLFSLASRSISLFTSSLSSASSEAVDFEKKISAIRTISTDNQLSFEAWAGGIREVADEFNIPLLEATSSVYTAISNQVVKGAEAFDFLRVNANLAITAQGSIADAISATSSILKSYNLDVSEVNDISAKLFKTAELGRVPLASIGETIGTVTVIASRAGISFDEVASSLATMTVQGIKPVKAITFLRNTILKVLKPTDAMKEAVEKMGFASAETAVRTLGLGRFLDELRKTTKGTASELATLLGSVRAMQAGFAISGPALSAYEENLAKIGVASKDFDERIKIAKESVGFNFQKELNQASTAMTNLGRQINETALQVIKGFGGLKNIIETIITLIKSGLVVGALALLNKGLVGLNLNLKLTAFNFTTMSRASGVASVSMKRLSLSAVRLGRTLKTAFRAFAPFLLIEGAFLLANKMESVQKKITSDQLASQTAVDKSFSNASKNRLKALKDFETASARIRDRATVDAIQANNKRLNSLKKTLKSAESSFNSFNKKQIESIKFSLTGLKDEEALLKDIISTTDSVLNSVAKGRDKLRDDIFGKGFSDLQKLPSLRENFNKAIIDGSAKEIKKAFEELTSSLQGAIAGSSNKSFINQLRSEIGVVLETTKTKTTEISRQALEDQKKLIAQKERLEKESRKRTRAQELLDRVDPLSVTKEKTSAGVQLVGQASIQSLIDAKAFAPTETEKQQIQAQIDTLTEFVSRRFVQIKTTELQAEKKKTVEQVSREYKSLLKLLKKDLEASKELKELQVVGEDLQNIFSTSINQGAGSIGNFNVKESQALLKLVDALKNDAEITSKTREDLTTFFNKAESTGFPFTSNIEELADTLQRDFGFDEKDQARLENKLKTLKSLFENTQALGRISSKTGRDAVRISQDQADQGKEALEIAKGKTKENSKNNTIIETTFKKGLKILGNLQARNKEVTKLKQGIKDINIESAKTLSTKNPLSTPVLTDPTLKQKKKEEEKTIQKEVTSEGTLTGLVEITQPLTDFWSKIFKGGMSKAIKDTSTGSSRDGAVGKINTLQLISATGGREEDTSTAKIKKSIKEQSKDILKTEEAIQKARKKGQDKEVSRLKEILRKQKETRLEARITEANDPKKLINQFFNNQDPDTNDQAKKTLGAIQAGGSLADVAFGTSKQLDLAGLKAFQLSEGMQNATSAIQFFTNQILSGRKKGLTNKERTSSIIQGGIGGATALAPTGNPWAILAGAVAGAGIAAYQTRERGGLIYRAGGGGVPAPAKGTDTVPTMLTQGEFVMNRHSTDRFYSQLKAMNSMTYRADGGRVSNSSVTVGDINVSPSQNSSESTTSATAIGNQLRREIKNGRLGSFS